MVQMEINVMVQTIVQTMMVIATRILFLFKKSASFMFALFFIMSCRSTSNESVNDQIASTNSASIKIDTLYLKPELFSMQGYFRVNKGGILYVQPELQNILSFDINGNYLRELLGSGEGPDKANGDLDYHGLLPDGNNLVLGSNYIFKEFNNEFDEIIEKIPFNWINRESIYRTEDLSNPSMYDYHYRDEPFIDSQWMPITNDYKIVVPININSYINPIANLTEKPENYFGNALTVGIVDLSSGKLEKVFRRHSEPFTKNKWLYFYNYPYREVDNSFIYVSDRLGHSVDVYDLYTYEYLGSFGQKGRFVNSKLDTYDTYEDFLSALSIEITLNYSYYTHIYSDKEEGYFFRSYHIKDLEPWGLQVYDGNRDLIFDGKVPFRFNVIGKFGEYYYADGIRDEEKNELAIYRFKLVEN